MKRVFALPLILIDGWSIFANPIALPTIEISELYFDESGNWELELGYYGVYQNEIPIDSISIISTSDTAKLSCPNLPEVREFLLLQTTALKPIFR